MKTRPIPRIVRRIRRPGALLLAALGFALAGGGAAGAAVVTSPPTVTGDNGIVEAFLNTGDVRIVLGNTASLSSYEFDSAGGNLIPAKLNSVGSQFSTDGFSSYADKPTSISEATLANGPGYGSLLVDAASGQHYIDLGNIFNTAGAQDLQYLMFDNNGNQIDASHGVGIEPDVVFISSGVAVPEPATLVSALGVLSLFLLTDYRRKPKWFA